MDQRHNNRYCNELVTVPISGSSWVSSLATSHTNLILKDTKSYLYKSLIGHQIGQQLVILHTDQRGTLTPEDTLTPDQFFYGFDTE